MPNALELVLKDMAADQRKCHLRCHSQPRHNGPWFRPGSIDCLDDALFAGMEFRTPAGHGHR